MANRRSIIMQPSGGLLLNRAVAARFGVIHAYPMNEGGGNKLHDLAVQNCVAPGSNLNITGGTSGWANSIKGIGVNFDGSNDHFVAAVTSSRGGGVGPAWVSFWFKTTSAGGANSNAAVSYGTGGTAQQFTVAIESGVVTFRADTSSNKATAGSGYNDGLWHHCFVSKPGTSTTVTGINIWVDGVSLTTTTTGSGTINVGTGSVVIGCTALLAGHFSGNITNVLIGAKAVPASVAQILRTSPYIVYETVKRRNIAIAGTTYNQTASDTITFSDSVTETAVYVRSISDPVTLADSATQNIVHVRSISDPVSLTDSVTEAANHARSISDPIGLTDVANVNHNLATSNSLTLLDAATETAVYVRSISDPVTLADSATENVDHVRSISDPVTLTDVANANHNLATSNSLGITDAIAEVTDHVRSISDPVALADSATENIDYARSISDPLNLAGQGVGQIAGINYGANDLGLTDQATSQTVRNRDASDTITLADSVTENIDHARSISDPVSLTDAATETLTHNLAASSSLGLSDSATENIDLARSVSDLLSLADAVDLKFEYARSLADTLGLTDHVISGATSESASSTLDFEDLVVAQKITAITTAYGTILEANSYFALRLYSELWLATSLTERKAALIQATRIIDRLNFDGDKTDSTQELEFPRGGDVFIPNDIKIASFEIAYLLIDGFDCEAETENLAVVSEGFSSVRTTYDRGIVQIHLAAGVPSIVAWRYLLPYLRDDKTIKLCRVN